MPWPIAMSRMEVQSAPDCDMKAILPRRGMPAAKEAFSLHDRVDDAEHVRADQPHPELAHFGGAFYLRSSQGMGDQADQDGEKDDRNPKIANQAIDP